MLLAVATKIPKEHLSKLMLQASFRRVMHIDRIIKGHNNAEYLCFGYFGMYSNFGIINLLCAVTNSAPVHSQVA